MTILASCGLRVGSLANTTTACSPTPLVLSSEMLFRSQRQVIHLWPRRRCLLSASGSPSWRPSFVHLQVSSGGGGRTRRSGAPIPTRRSCPHPAGNSRRRTTMSPTGETVVPQTDFPTRTSSWWPVLLPPGLGCPLVSPGPWWNPKKPDLVTAIQSANVITERSPIPDRPATWGA